MGLRTRLGQRLLRSDPSLSVDGWIELLKYAGQSYQLMPQQTLVGRSADEVSQSFAGYVQGMMKSNGVVFACMLSRMLLFSEARFKYRQLRSGRPGDLFGTPDLGILESPWPNGTTGDLLTRAIQDVDLEGNFYAYRDGDVLRRMRPDWVSIAVAGPNERDVEIVGYGFHPGGYNSGQEPLVMMPEQVAHWAPIPDPEARFRGMSWLTPVIREVQADSATTVFKQRFFEKGATPNMIITLDLPKEQRDLFVKAFEASNVGAQNAYKTLFLSAGSTAQVVGANLQELDFKVTQGAGETRIAAAAGVPPIIVGLSEGLDSATYSNYSQAIRRFADGTMRPLWRNMAASFASVVPVPPGAELWYDDRDIQYLKEDQKDAAEIQTMQAAAIKQLVDAGYDAASVIDAITSGDMTRLNHTGLFSVQLQPPGTTLAPASPDQLPAPPPVRALLERFLREESATYVQ